MKGTIVPIVAAAVLPVCEIGKWIQCLPTPEIEDPLSIASSVLLGDICAAFWTTPLHNTIVLYHSRYLQAERWTWKGSFNLEFHFPHIQGLCEGLCESHYKLNFWSSVLVLNFPWATNKENFVSIWMSGMSFDVTAGRLLDRTENLSFSSLMEYPFPLCDKNFCYEYRKTIPHIVSYSLSREMGDSSTWKYLMLHLSYYLSCCIANTYSKLSGTWRNTLFSPSFSVHQYDCNFMPLL